MVSRREKLSRSFLKLREQILEKQLVLLADDDPTNQVSIRRRSFLKLRELVLRSSLSSSQICSVAIRIICAGMDPDLYSDPAFPKIVWIRIL
jgi:hypothetical protein